MRNAWITLIAAVLVFCPGTVAQEELCSLCDAGQIVCPTCKGGGTTLGTCRPCVGNGKTQCVKCAVPESTMNRRPGNIDCPNRDCKDGYVLGRSGYTNRCKLCDGRGDFRCPWCDGDPSPTCETCDGTGEATVPCYTCVGTGHIDCPLSTAAPDTEACGFCEDGFLDCPSCPSREPSCQSCGGDGKAPCKTCSGLGNQPCSTCRATGKMGVRTSRSPGTCTECRGTGIERCEDCWGVDIDCEYCEGGRPTTGCMDCVFDGRLPCDNCLSGGYARFEIYGDFLLRADRPKEAVVYFKSAATVARDLSGPLNVVEGEVTALLEVAERVDRLRGGSIRRWVNMRWFPLDGRERHWPESPKDQFFPWYDDVWMRAHRRRVVARLNRRLAVARRARD